MNGDYPHDLTRRPETIGFWEGLLAWIALASASAAVVVVVVMPLWSIYSLLALYCGWPGVELWRAFLVPWALFLLYLIGEQCR